MSNFKVGQKVIAMRDIFYSSTESIKKGKTYTVLETGPFYTLGLAGFPGAYWEFDFKDAKGVKRDKKGRFLSDKSPLLTPLKKGSLYGVKRKNGRIVARLRGTVTLEKGKYGIFTLHKQSPFLTRITNVSFANKDEVAEYLNQ